MHLIAHVHFQKQLKLQVCVDPSVKNKDHSGPTTTFSWRKKKGCDDKINTAGG